MLLIELVYRISEWLMEKLQVTYTHKRHTVQKIYGEKVTCWWRNAESTKRNQNVIRKKVYFEEKLRENTKYSKKPGNIKTLKQIFQKKSLSTTDNYFEVKKGLMFDLLKLSDLIKKLYTNLANDLFIYLTFM